MRRNGEGSIVKRKDGRWQASLQVNGTRRTLYGRSQKEVRAKLRQLQQQLYEDGALPEQGARTVAQLMDAWLDSAPNLKPTTVAQYRDFFDMYVRSALGAVRLEKVTPERLQRLYATYTPSVANAVHRLLHRAFAVALLWRWLPSNPCDRVLKPTYKPKTPNLWTRAELQTFLDGTADNWLSPLFVLLLGTGMRLGEALALTWKDVERGVAVSVAGTLHRVEGEAVVTAPKTPSAIRTILVPPEVTSALERQQEQQETWRRAADAEWQVTGFVFTGRTGKPLHRSVPEHAMKRFCQRLGLPHVTPHGLRHLHASLLIDSGLPITTVAARLGHANPQITMKLYAHALQGRTPERQKPSRKYWILMRKAGNVRRTTNRVF